MDALKAEIARKRKQFSKFDDVVDTEKKFFKRGDLIEKQAKEYWAKQAEKKAANASTKEVKVIDAEAAVEALTTSGEDGKLQLPRDECVRRLRERSQPILLFGEDEVDALRRLRRHEIDQPDMKPGRRNEFQDALSAIDQEYLNEVIEGTSGKKEDDTKGKHDIKADKLESFDDIQELARKLDPEHGGHYDKCDLAYRMFNYLLQKWAHNLNDREEETKRTPFGRSTTATHRQTCMMIKPLFIQLKRNNVPNDILKHLARICRHLADKEYVKANTCYMEMAIGNAPWPVGATRTGIHIRPGSHKSYEAEIAHVLNDETQRKFIQALKRLITRCQEIFPAPPSKCIDYISPEAREKDIPKMRAAKN